MPFSLPIERLFDARPLISPTENWWESGVTFNTAAVWLAPTAENAAAYAALLGSDSELQHPDGIAVLHYRARPDVDPGFPWTRSYVGISIHKPDLTPIKRFEVPVVEPGGSDCDEDFFGVEDPRITYLDGAWWMVYCGVAPVLPPTPDEAWRGSVCVARSEDLVHWTKVGAVEGTGDGFSHRSSEGLLPPDVSNKDGVLFPDRIDGRVMLLHRPMRPNVQGWSTCLAVADDPTGPYEDLGPIHQAVLMDDSRQSWPGAGSVPIKIGEGRYVSIEHTGNYLKDGRRRYVLDAFLYDFNHFDPERPESIMVARMDDIMRPETDFEVRGPFHDSVANVVFTCGSYVHDGWLYIVYGGGDSFILAARLPFEPLVAQLEAIEAA